MIGTVMAGIHGQVTDEAGRLLDDCRAWGHPVKQPCRHSWRKVEPVNELPSGQNCVVDRPSYNSALHNSATLDGASHLTILGQHDGPDESDAPFR